MFTLRIKTDNAAFEPVGSEIARILRDVADKIEHCELANEFDRNIRLMDANGNTVGEAKYR